MAREGVGPAFDGVRDIREWRSRKVAEVGETLNRTADELRLRLESDLGKVRFLTALKGDRHYFNKRVAPNVKQRFDADAARILTDANRSLGAILNEHQADGPELSHTGIRGADAVTLLQSAATVIAPTLGIGLGVYLVSALAFTTVTKWFFIKNTAIDGYFLSFGIFVIAIAAYFFLSSPGRVIGRKRNRVLARYDKYVSEQILSGANGGGNTLQGQLESKIKQAAAEAEQALEND